jgi:hypothetical protein
MRFVIVALIVGSLSLLAGTKGTAQSPLRDLLPEQVQGVIEIRDWPKLAERWKQTQFGQLLQDPSLKPFWDTQREAIDAQLASAGLRLRISLDDLQSVAAGEVTFAWYEVDDARRPFGVALMADVTNRDAAVRDVMKSIEAGLKDRKATRESKMIAGVETLIFTLPRKAGDLVVDRIVYAVTPTHWMASDRPEIIEQLLGQMKAAAPASGVTASKEWQAVFAKTQIEDGEDIRWFIRPLGLGRVLRAAGGGRKNRYDTDILLLLKEQGFDAVRAAGGALRFAGEHDLVHRGYVYAPPVTAQPDRYLLAARVLQFPNGPTPKLPEWLPTEMASVMSMNWKLQEAFWATESLVNQWVGGEDIFKEMLRGIKEDVDGPKVDVVKDIVEHLGERFWLVTDNLMPASAESERMLVAVELKDAARVWSAIEKVMKSDPHASRVDYPHHTIYEVRPGDANIDLDEEGLGEFGIDSATASEVADETKPPPLLNQWAITVYENHLLFSSHASMIIDCSERKRQAKPLSAETAEDIRRVRTLLDQTGESENALLRVVRTKYSWRVKYELMRKGELGASNGVLASLLRRSFQAATEDGKERPKLNAAQLPEFETVAKYFQSAGSSIETTSDGWLITGIVVKPQP